MDECSARRLAADALAAEGDAIVRIDAPPVTYAALRERVATAAAQLEDRGACPGALVAVREADATSALVAVLAAWQLGAAVLVVDPRTPGAVAERTLARARPRVVVGAKHPGSCERVAGARALDPRAALVLFTSGSTGEPKGVVLGAAGIAANVAAILAYLPVRETRGAALTGPLAYSYGLVGQALTTLTAGRTLALVPHGAYPAAIVAALRTLRVGGLSSVPGTLRKVSQALVDAGETLPLRFVANAGASLDASLIALLTRAFPDAELFNQYGLTEASPRVSAVSSRDARFFTGSVGRAIGDVEIRTDGDLVLVRGPSIMLGYLDDEAATRAAVREDGWLVTGDVGAIDADGYLVVLGRRDGVVKCGGERVSVEEIAATLRSAPGIRDAHVIAAPHPERGALLWAFLEGEISVEVRAFVRAQLPPAKRPAHLVSMACLPRSENGKVREPDLRAHIADVGAWLHG